MMIAPPISGAQAGHATGGGLLDTIKGAIGGAGASGAQQATQADGSVGLFDGVLKKALITGGLGAAVGFLPFIPGGPVIGGLLGALGGAAMQVFSNWRTMQTIKQENAAMLGAMGVQTDDPQVQQILQSGNVQQLIPYMQQRNAQQAQQAQLAQQAQQTGRSTGAVPSGSAAGQSSGSSASNIAQVYDPETGTTRLIDMSTGRVVQQDANAPTAAGTAAAPARADTTQSPMPTQGGVLITTGGGAQAGARQLGATSTDLARVLVQLQQQVDLLARIVEQRQRAEAAIIR